MKTPAILLSTACAVGIVSFGSAVKADYEERGIDKDKPSIGVILSERDGRVRVAHVIQDGPADEAGLQRGDEITSVDGESIRSARDVFRRLRDKEADDEVEIEVQRDDDTETVEVSVQRLEKVLEAAKDDGRLRSAMQHAALQAQIRQLQSQVRQLERQIAQQDRRTPGRQVEFERDRRMQRDRDDRRTIRDRDDRRTRSDRDRSAQREYDERR